MIVKKQIKIKVPVVFADRGYMHNRLSTQHFDYNQLAEQQNITRKSAFTTCLSLQCEDQTENPFSMKVNRRENG